MNQADDTQAAVFRFLADPAIHGDGEVVRIDTHANVVFLAGDRAFKIKRAIRLPFLDYSTLPKRKAACASELEVNHPFAPEIYRRIVPIVRRANGQFALNGDGEPIEWAVEMLRFDERQTLDRLADTHVIDDELAQKLGVMVSAIHDRAPAAEADSWIAALERFLDQNTQAFRAAPSLFQADLVSKLDQAARSELEKLRPLLSSRGERGLIRRGHGDLHLGNIVLLDGRPVPFDAIEFDAAVATGDVLYELAFLLMDLLERGLARTANRAFNAYFAQLKISDDLDGLAALPFFLSLRAAIRAKVTAARMQYADVKDHPTFAKSARAYFHLAMKLISPPPATLIAVGGLSGTGKSLLARELAPFVAPAPGALVLRSDVERKRLFGVVETERLAPDAYRPAANEQVYEIVADKASRTVSAHHSVIVDAVFARPQERTAVGKVAASSGAAFTGLFLSADLQTRLSRVGTRVADASDASAAVALQQETFDLGHMTWIEIDASGSPSETLAHACLAIGISQRFA